MELSGKGFSALVIDVSPVIRDISVRRERLHSAEGPHCRKSIPIADTAAFRGTSLPKIQYVRGIDRAERTGLPVLYPSVAHSEDNYGGVREAFPHIYDHVIELLAVFLIGLLTVLEDVQAILENYHIIADKVIELTVEKRISGEYRVAIIASHGEIVNAGAAVIHHSDSVSDHLA